MRLKLVHQMPGSEEFKTWAGACNDLSDAEVSHGVLRCLDFTGFFTVPAFRELCKPDPVALGLLTAESAFIEVCNATSPVQRFKWSHPAVYHAGADTGWFNLRNGFANLRSFSGHYDARVKQVLAGEILEIPTLTLIEEKPAQALGAEEIHSRIAEMKKKLGL